MFYNVDPLFTTRYAYTYSSNSDGTTRVKLYRKFTHPYQGSHSYISNLRIVNAYKFIVDIYANDSGVTSTAKEVEEYVQNTKVIVNFIKDTKCELAQYVSNVR